MSTKDSHFHRVMAEYDLDARISQIAGVLMDVKDHVRWAYQTKVAYLIKQESPEVLYYYTEIKVPWPFENRDLVVRMDLSQDSGSRVLTVHADVVGGLVPLHKGIVRVPFSRAVWTISPLDSTRIHVRYEVQINPGGSVPAWLVNLFAANGPYDSFQKLRIRVALPQYQDLHLPFIKN